MKVKRLFALLFVAALVIGLTACGGLPDEIAARFSAKNAHMPDLEAASLTVYDTWTGESWLIEDDSLVERLRKVGTASEWEALTGLGNQISAVPNYAIDLGNGTCLAPLGDGYVEVGSAYVFLSEESFRIEDGCQYQVSVELTDLLYEMTVRSYE